jgi:Protein of unknown function (DUF1064)
MKASERKAWGEFIGRSTAADAVKTMTKLDRPAVRAALGKADQVTKYGSRAVRVDGRRFASALEADRYLELKALRLAGQVSYFLRQVPFELGAGVTYRVDFMVAWSDPPPPCPNRLSWEDTKGFLTETSRVKLRLVRELYGVDVRLLRRSDVKRMRT